MENNNTKNTVATYNIEAGEMLAQVMTGVNPWQWQTPRVNMSVTCWTRSQPTTMACRLPVGTTGRNPVRKIEPVGENHYG